MHPIHVQMKYAPKVLGKSRVAAVASITSWDTSSLLPGAIGDSIQIL